jgi:hypothetical protein
MNKFDKLYESYMSEARETDGVPEKYKKVKDFIDEFNWFGEKENVFTSHIKDIEKYIGKGNIVVFEGGISTHDKISKEMVRIFKVKDRTDNLNSGGDPKRIKYGTYKGSNGVVIDTYTSEYLILNEKMWNLLNIK